MLMDTTMLEIAVRTAGVLPQAVEDAVRRLQGHFEAHSNPSPEMISAQLAALRQAAPHLFPRQASVSEAGVPVGVVPEMWQSLSPSSKLGWLREHGYGLPPVERRRPPLPLSAEQVAELAAMKPQARMDAYRALQQAQQQP
jgi:hypothetical protein